MPASTSSLASRLKLLSGYRALAHLLGLLVLIQAWMAGQSLFGDFSIVVHGIVGNVSYLIAVVALVLAAVARAPKGALIVAAVVVLLMTVQIGIGYMGRESAGAASWHIPNGVLLFGLTVFQISKATAVVKGTAANA